MKKKIKSKLTLRRQTIHTLNPHMSLRIKGGTAESWEDSCIICYETVDCESQPYSCTCPQSREPSGCDCPTSWNPSCLCPSIAC
jgi:hypothetical protein